MHKIICNMKGSRTIDVSNEHLETIEKYSLFADLLDSTGLVDETVLNRLQLNVRSLLDSTHGDAALVTLSHEVIFHPNMKALGLHQLILLYLDWEKEKIAANVPTEE